MRMSHKDIVFGPGHYWRICRYEHGELIFVCDPIAGYYQFFVLYTEKEEEMWGH